MNNMKLVCYDEGEKKRNSDVLGFHLNKLISWWAYRNCLST